MLSVRTKKIELVRKVLGVAGLIVVGALIIFAIQSQKQFTTLTLSNVSLKVEIANTSQKREHGLCCRESVPADQGMLFVYNSPGDHRFWMKDTKIPLDMFWIDSGKQIVHIEENVRPDSYPGAYGTNIPAQYILETNAGFAKEYHIKNRDSVAFSL